jgi:hypothetical protein
LRPIRGRQCAAEINVLNIPQLAQVKARDPYVYESLQQIVNAINALGRATGVDPSGSIAQPDPIGGISVLAANGIFDVAVTDNSAVHRGIYYFRGIRYVAEFHRSPGVVHGLVAQPAGRAWESDALLARLQPVHRLDPFGAGDVWLATHGSGGRRVCGSNAAAFCGERHRDRAARRQRIRHRAHVGDQRHDGVALFDNAPSRRFCSGALAGGMRPGTGCPPKGGRYTNKNFGSKSRN